MNRIASNLSIRTIPDPSQLAGQNRIRWQGRKLVSFSGCDYFRLSQHAAVCKAVRDGLRRYGLSVSASRLTTGHHRIYDALEVALARFFDADSALATSSGYGASTMAAQALAGDYTHVLLDARAHPALKDAARHFECPVRTFKHRNPRDLEQVASRCGPGARVIVLTDGMFSHDGSVAPLRAYLNVLPAGARILLDDAHGAGVLGEKGRGTAEHEGVDRDRIIQCISLSKAFGVFGGAILSTRALRRRVIERSDAFMGCTALPLPLAAAAVQSVALLRRGSELRRRLAANAELVKSSLRRAGLRIPDHAGPIVAVHLPSAAHSRKLRSGLLRAGIHPPFLKYAGARQGGFRFVISSEHTLGQLESLIGVLTSGCGDGEKRRGPGN